jgi:hypothetical protein
MSQRDPREVQRRIIFDGPTRGGWPERFPDTPQLPKDISISTSPFPTVSPWAFLAGAVGNIIGGLVGQNQSSGGNQQQQGGSVSEMPSMTELMMQFENNRLLRELLKATNKSKEETSFDLGTRSDPFRIFN